MKDGYRRFFMFLVINSSSEIYVKFAKQQKPNHVKILCRSKVMIIESDELSLISKTKSILDCEKKSSEE